MIHLPSEAFIGALCKQELRVSDRGSRIVALVVCRFPHIVYRFLFIGIHDFKAAIHQSFVRSTDRFQQGHRFTPIRLVERDAPDAGCVRLTDATGQPNHGNIQLCLDAVLLCGGQHQFVTGTRVARHAAPGEQHGGGIVCRITVLLVQEMLIETECPRRVCLHAIAILQAVGKIEQRARISFTRSGGKQRNRLSVVSLAEQRVRTEYTGLTDRHGVHLLVWGREEGIRSVQRSRDPASSTQR